MNENGMNEREKNEQSIVRLLSVGTYIPDQKMTSGDIAEASGIPQHIVESKLGIRQKPVPGPDDHPCAMGVAAAKEAIRRAQIAPEEIDLIIYIGEEYKEYPVWTAALQLQHEIGAVNAWGFDMGSRCCTAIMAVRTAKSMMLGDSRIRTVLLAGGYRNGDLIDLTDPNTRFMANLGAGGGAMLLQRGAGPSYPEVLDSAIITDGSFAQDVIIQAGGTKQPLTAELLAQGQACFRVPDPERMKSRLDAVSMQRFSQVVEQAIQGSGYTVSNIGFIGLLHMKRSAHEFVLRSLGITEERSVYLEDYGHIGQFDPILCLELGVRRKLIQPGSIVVLAAAGIGYAWGALTLRWGDEA
ncbi:MULTISPECIES: 3-oxoacyl-ACP synthase [Paenibacillus]|uniref:3-oxoacyl-ACP synthase n=1 Tax=Paenibacillus alvei TaxID=44250 RepID=A0ABT4EH66_PAEAL|nr:MULTISPECIES: 3-oxoacyl-ACP synthase [Paenibacillus]MCY9533070.1 3-oxoacyl-ACP synthase [Paenibacillus alvei]SDF97460.1 3-oxoacyl-[acyl-carrier-protein] synthase-3 [Paenibacillus sp. cl6col]